MCVVMIDNNIRTKLILAVTFIFSFLLVMQYITVMVKNKCFKLFHMIIKKMFLNLFTIKILLCVLFLLYCSVLLPHGSAYTINKPKEYRNLNLNGIDFSFNKFNLEDLLNQVSYWLYTRELPDGLLLKRNDPRMLNETIFNVNNPIKVIVHDWLGTFDNIERVCKPITQAYLKLGEYVVVCADWTPLTMALQYAAAKNQAKYIGHDVADFVKTITNDGLENVHLIGFGMGAHIVGFAGKKLNGRIPRITGLDPVKPLYLNSNPSDRINQNDARFVDVIHTNALSLGLLQSLGHIDFYPNGGRSQINCKLHDIETGGMCSHNRAYIHFARSILAKDVYTATRCSNWNAYESNVCNDVATNTFMGEHVDTRLTGRYYLYV